MVPVIVVVVAAILGAAGVIVFIGPAESAGASVRLEAAGRPGTDPFTTSVTIGETAAFPDTIHAITTHQVAHLATDSTTGGLQAQGSAPGLYGGTGNNAVCDPHQLADFLTHNPTKATAWANVLGIRASQIADYITTLTPVVLTTDTRVTNHGYRNGTATTLQSVLQAGTAVLVDPHGTPRVKCGCGNPLTPPTSTPIATTTGTPWTSYQPATVTTITPTPKPQDQFTLTNLHTGTTYTQPTGNGHSTWLAATSNPSNDEGGGSLLTSSDDGRTWSTLTSQCDWCGFATSGLASGGGKWVATAFSQGQGFASVSENGRTWSQSGPFPNEYLGPVAYGSGRWLAVGFADSQDTVPTVHSSTDGVHWSQITPTGLPGAGSSGYWSWVSLAYGNGTWVALANNCAGQCFTSEMFTSANGKDWQAVSAASQSFDAGAQVAYGSGQWMVTGSIHGGCGEPGAAQACPSKVSTSRDLQHWSEAAAPVYGTQLAFGNGTWLLAAPQGQSSRSTTFYASRDGKSWSTAGTVEGNVLALASGSS